MNLRKRLWLFVGLVLAGLVFFGLLALKRIFLNHSTYPATSFLFLPEDRFMDFFHINYMVSQRDPYFEGSSYPPFILVFAYLWSFFIPGNFDLGPFELRDTWQGVFALFLLYGLSFSIIFHYCYLFFKPHFNPWNIKKKIPWKLFILFCGAIVINAPMLFSIDRGNYLIVAIVFLVLFCFYYDKNDYLAAVFLALAACVKAFPVFIFLVFFLDKKWRALILGMVVGGGVTGLSFLFFEGSFLVNFKRFILATLNFTGGLDATNAYYYRFGVGLRSFIGGIWLFIDPKRVMIPEVATITRYASLTLLFLVFCLCCYDRRTEYQILYLTILMVLFLNPSYFYNLAYLLGATFIFILKKNWSKVDYVLLFFLCLVFVPKAVRHLVGSFDGEFIHMSISSVLDPMILLFILFLGFFSRVVLKTKGDLKPTFFPISSEKTKRSSKK